MAPNVEVVKFLATPAYLADHITAKPGLEGLSKLPGLIATYYGVETQEPEYGYVVNVWESLKDHDAFTADTELFHSVMGGFGASLAPNGIKYINDVTFNTEDPHVSLRAPTTEFALWTLNEGVDSKTFQEKLDKLVTLAISWGPSSGIHPGGWGPVARNEKQFVVMLGWDNLEIFQKSVQASPEALALIGELKELAALDLKHTVLKKF